MSRSILYFLEIILRISFLVALDTIYKHPRISKISIKKDLNLTYIIGLTLFTHCLSFSHCCTINPNSKDNAKGIWLRLLASAV